MGINGVAFGVEVASEFLAQLRRHSSVGQCAGTNASGNETIGDEHYGQLSNLDAGETAVDPVTFHQPTKTR
jgi:hypothetical protein